MRFYIPLAVLASTVAAVPAESAWDQWGNVPTTTPTRTPPPTTSTVALEWPTWGISSSTTSSTSTSKSTSTWADWSSTSSSRKHWTGWQSKKPVSSHATPSGDGKNHWAPLSDPYNLMHHDSAVNNDNTPSRTWSDVSDDSSSLDAWFAQRPGPDPSAPTATLLPVAHWDHDDTNLDHVKPQDCATQYYMPHGTTEKDAHQFAWINTNFTDNAIMLDHSKFLDYIHVASTGALTIKFSDDKAFILAQNTWHKGMVMVFYDGTCGVAMNCHAVCQSLAFDSNSKTCEMSTKSATFEQVASYFTMQWGQYQPNRTRRTNSGGSWADWQETGSGRGSTPGNVSIGGSTNNRDCVAPKDTVHGLPTACLGQFFDEDIDEYYGLVEVTETDFADSTSLFPNLWYDNVPASALDEEEYAEDEAALELSKPLVKRWSFNPLAGLKRLAKAVLPPIKGITAPYDIPLIKYPFPLNAPTVKGKRVQSPWNEQLLIKSWVKQNGKAGPDSGGGFIGAAARLTAARLSIFCVDCGASGTANIAGNIGVSVFEGVDYVKTSFDMNLAIALKIGVVAQFEHSENIAVPLVTIPLSPLTVGVATIGPYLKAGAELNLNLKANGKVLGGGTMSFANAKVSLDILKLDGKADGWTPSFDPVFEADGEIAARADFGVPVALALGLNVLKWSADIAIVDRPAIVAKAQASITANLNGAKFVEVAGCEGISAGLDFKNEVYAQFSLGAKGNKYPLAGLPEKQITSTCIKPFKPTPTTTSTAADSTPTDGDEKGEEEKEAEKEKEKKEEEEEEGKEKENEKEKDNETEKEKDEEEGTSSSGEERRRAMRYFKRETDTASSKTDGGKTDGTKTSATKISTTPTTIANISDDDDTVIDITAEIIAANGTQDNTPFVAKDSNEITYKRTDGYIFSSLVDSSAQYQAYACSNGNIHVFGKTENITASDCQEDFTMVEHEGSGTIIVADGYERMFVYYPDEMKATGVSRIRAVDIENMPKGSEELIWFPDSSTTDVGALTASIYFPVDQNNDAFYPAMCKYKDSKLYNKLFIVKDPVAGLLTLKDPALKYSISGGDIDSCYFIPLMDGKAYGTEGENGGLYTDVPGDDETTSTSKTATTSTKSGATSATSKASTTVKATTTKVTNATTTSSSKPVVTP